jgi:hypothetical protein
MRKISLFAVIALLACLEGCDSLTDFKDQPVELELGSIQGFVVLDPDVTGTVAGTVVQVFCSQDAACNNQPGMTVVVGENGEFVFNGVCCGTHYLGLWKDNDGNGMVSSGDYSFDRLNPERCCVQKDGVDYHTLTVFVVP